MQLKSEDSLKQIFQELHPLFIRETGEEKLTELEIRKEESGDLSEYSFITEGNVRSCSFRKPEREYINDELDRKAIYIFLEELYQVESDWGILTGVKPVKLYKNIKLSGEDPDRVFSERFHVKRRKTELVKEVFKLQEPVLRKNDDRNHISLYIGIPICPEKCSYCSFVSTISDKKRVIITEYLTNLKEEITAIGNDLKDRNFIVDSVYFGGGTPGLLKPEEFRALIKTLREYFDLENAEITFEAGRAELISEELLQALKNESVTRICLNPQSMNDKTLNRIGRHNTREQILSAYDLIRQYDFSVNMDLIRYLEDESASDFIKSLEEVIELKPENITVHDLALKKGSRLKTETQRIKDPYSKEDLQKQEELLKEAGYRPYYMYRQKYTVGKGENTGYTRPYSENIYNIEMMAEERTIIGFGAGSTTKFHFPGTDRFERFITIKDVRTYNSRFPEVLAKKRKAFAQYLN